MGVRDLVMSDLISVGNLCDWSNHLLKVVSPTLGAPKMYRVLTGTLMETRSEQHEQPGPPKLCLVILHNVMIIQPS